MALQELIYTSLATPDTTEESVSQILSTSQQNNKSLEITGLLLFDGSRYVQIVEGSPENLDKIYSSIVKDNRHYGLELLHRGGIKSRAFEEWRMAYESLPKGFLHGLAETMAYASMDVEDEVMAEGESFGARLNGLFMEAVTAK